MRVEGATHRAADKRETMKTFELLSIIGSVVAVGITLGVVVLGSVGNLRAEVRTDIAGVRTEMRTLRAEVNTEMQASRAEVNTGMQALRSEVRADIRALEHRLVAVEQRQARTEGLLEWLRDAIMATRPQDPPTQKEST